MSSKVLRGALVVLAALVLAVAVVACGGDDEGEQPGAPAKSATVALLLPENVTARWEGEDRPQFIKALNALVPNAKQRAQRPGDTAVSG